jgi:hypothetical protein
MNPAFVIKDPKVAHASAPACWLQAFDITAEWVTLKFVEGAHDADLILFRETNESFSG